MSFLSENNDDDDDDKIQFILFGFFTKLTSLLHFVKIESISGTLVLRWINSQLGRILSWVERAIQQEVST